MDKLSREHLVEYYVSDSLLTTSIAKFVNKGDVGVVVATKRHAKDIKRKINPASKQPIFLDAETTLSLFLVDDVPDRELFEKEIGGILRKVGKKGKKVRVYGEMVALLWESDRIEAALLLESYWNDLQKKSSFSLMCAYPLKIFGPELSTEVILPINDTHSRVLPMQI